MVARARRLRHRRGRPLGLLVLVFATLGVSAPVSASGFARPTFTLAGTGPAATELPAGGFSGDGGVATLARLDTPTALVEDLGGQLLFTDSGNSRIRRVATTGLITTAFRRQLGTPVGIARRRNGDLLIADATKHRIWIASTSGAITVLAGTGTAGFSGDGGLAWAAKLQNPSGVIEAADGSVFIADTGNQRVRRVDEEGRIGTVVGNGRFGFAGDRGPATLAALAAPTGLATASDGALLIADSENHRIRKVDAGVITTVAGGRAAGFGGDGGPALNARLHRPLGLAAFGSGGYLVADSLNNRIRKVSAAGLISTVAGKSRIGGYGGDGGVPTRARLRTPTGMLRTTRGELVIADADNNVLRYVSGRRAVRLAIAASAWQHRRSKLGTLHMRIVATQSCIATIVVRDRYGRALARLRRRAGPTPRRVTMPDLPRSTSVRVFARGRAGERSAAVTAVRPAPSR